MSQDKKTAAIKRVVRNKNFHSNESPISSADKRIYPQSISLKHSSVQTEKMNAKQIDENNFCIDQARAAILDRSLSGELTRLALIERALCLAADHNHTANVLAVALLKCLHEGGHLQ